MRIITTILLGIGLAVWSCGCLNIDYIGQYFPPDDSGTMVAFYDLNESLPNDLVRIGYAEFDAPGDYTLIDLRSKLLAEADQVGAQVVKLVQMVKVQSGEFVSSATQDAAPTGSWVTLSVSDSGNPVYTGTFGRQSSLADITVKRYIWQVRADFYVSKNRFETIRHTAAPALTATPAL